MNDLGSFNAKLSSETWDGNRQTLQGNGYQIGLAIRPVQTLSASTDPTLPTPYEVSEDPAPEVPWNESSFPPLRILRWRWDGDPKKIDGFQIYRNGEAYRFSAGSDNMEEYVNLPGECEKQVRWQVAAVSGSTISSLSKPVQYILQPCKVFLQVSFDSILLSNTIDGWPGAPCDDAMDAYFEISVGDESRSFWGGTYFMAMGCGQKQFSDITGEPYLQKYGPMPNVITIPLSPDESPSSLWIRAKFWDYDDWPNPDDLFATFAEHPLLAYYPADGEMWISKDSPCGVTITTGLSITSDARSRLTYTYSIYPNPCRDTPP